MSGHIGCDICGKGHYRARVLDRYDAGALVGLDGVVLVRVPARVCTACGAVMLEGEALDRAIEGLTVVLIEAVKEQQTEIEALRAEMNDRVEKLERAMAQRSAGAKGLDKNRSFTGVQVYGAMVALISLTALGAVVVVRKKRG